MQGDPLFFGRKVLAESFDELRRCCLEKVDTATNGPGFPALSGPTWIDWCMQSQGL
jgi:hypothetical protein